MQSISGSTRKNHHRPHVRAVQHRVEFRHCLEGLSSVGRSTSAIGNFIWSAWQFGLNAMPQATHVLPMSVTHVRCANYLWFACNMYLKVSSWFLIFQDTMFRLAKYCFEPIVAGLQKDKGRDRGSYPENLGRHACDSWSPGITCWAAFSRVGAHHRCRWYRDASTCLWSRCTVKPLHCTFVRHSQLHVSTLWSPVCMQSCLGSHPNACVRSRDRRVLTVPSTAHVKFMLYTLWGGCHPNAGVLSRERPVLTYSFALTTLCFFFLIWPFGQT